MGKTGCSGEDHWAAKLTKKDVRRIRRLWDKGVTQAKIAYEYNVNRSTICKIVKNNLWKDEA